MNQMIRTRQLFCVSVIAASSSAQPAILSIAGTLGIEPKLASARLASLPAVLAENVTPAEARRMSALLTAFGFRVRLDPVSAASGTGGQTGRLRDLAVQTIAGSERPAVVDRLAQIAGRDAAEVLESLAGPEGLVLRGLADDRIAALKQGLNCKATLRLTVSDPLTATFDAFTVDSALPTAELVRLGLGGCPISGAVAFGMNQATAGHLERRAGASIAVFNRAFLRYDLFVVSAPGFGARELAGFLDSRSRTWRGMASNGQQRVDCDLPYGVAKQFIADYSAIGLEVRAKLRGHGT